LIFSGLYLAIVNITLLYLPFAGTSPVSTLHRTNLMLGALQGLLGSCLGVFFVSGQAKDKDTASTPDAAGSPADTSAA